MRRRAVLAGVPSALLFSGCTELLAQNEADFEAERAVVDESARSEANYTEATRTENTVERNYETVDRTVVVINKLTEYSKALDLPLDVNGDLARFTVLASPGVTLVEGNPANPIEDMSRDELAMRVQQQYETIENVEALDEREAELLGETVTVGRYEADAETGETSTKVNLHVAKGRSERSDGGPDFIVTVGVHPSDVDEQDNVDRMNEGVEHPT
jgi:hypothetical protein